MEQIKIALLGYGTVGKGVADLLEMNREQLVKNCGKELTIAKILVRDREKHEEQLVRDNRFTTEFNAILEDDSIDVVVEVMGGIYPAVSYMLQVMDRKKHVVTANKMALAIEGDALFSKAKEVDRHLFYEASVGGAIPIIRQVNESLNGNYITYIAGIMNGTSNYMLTGMGNGGMGFEEALKIAQDLGYAEADPTADVGGYDTLYKLVVLSSLAFQTKVDYKQVYRCGIESITSKDMEYAKNMNCVVKLLAVGKKEADMLELSVQPTMIPITHPLGAVDDVYNGFFVSGNASGDIVTTGRGAGSLPTAGAVLSDLLAIAKNAPKDFLVTGEKQKVPVKAYGEITNSYYMHLEIKDTTGCLGAVTSAFEKYNMQVEKMTQERGPSGKALVFLVTGEIRARELEQVLADLKNFACVKRVVNTMPIYCHKKKMV